MDGAEWFIVILALLTIVSGIGEVLFSMAKSYTKPKEEENGETVSKD